MLHYLFPTNNFQVETSDPPAVVRAKLQALIGETPALDPVGDIKRAFTFQNSAPQTPFFGAFAADGVTFNIRPSKRRRNAWRPQITGKIQQTWAGSEVMVEMRVQPFALVFTLSYVLLIVAFLLFNYSDEGTTPLPFLIVMGLMPMLLYAGALLAFWTEAKPAQSAITHALR